MDQEVEHFWKARSLKRSKVLYGLLTYGGLCTALIQLLVLYNDGNYGICWVIVALQRGAFPMVIAFGLNAMMASRVYAMYSRSKTALTILGFEFVIIQVLSAATFIAFMATTTVSVSPGLPVPCSSTAISSTIERLEAASILASCAYEATLLAMVMYRLIQHVKEDYGESIWNFNTLLAVMTRDHVFYFVIALLNWIIQAIPLIPGFPADLTNNVNVPWVFFTALMNDYIACLIGPIMMLSIRQFDAKRAQYGSFDELELTSVQFASREFQTQSETQSESVHRYS